MLKLSCLHSLHFSGKKTDGVNINDSDSLKLKKKKILDSFPCKYWSVKNAIDSAITLLSIDQIIMSKEIK